ncbi:MAG: NUDIX hydrolase [Clostridiales bacterium]|jgi:ADP-ribose pyrophosphatase YjhB (NUDIX family)|nr:NUDIX hydrolase [Clostridiales bacterium]
MIQALSCGGVVIHRDKILLLYKNQCGKYIGWVLPKGTLEPGESHKQTAWREVREEAGVNARIVKYIGKTRYSFKGASDVVDKTVHWYLMRAMSFHCQPQAEEYFADAGFYKRHEAIHLLKFSDERQILSRALAVYDSLREARSGGR